MPLLRLLLLTSVVVGASGCVERGPAPPTFPVATENEAAARVRAFFDAYVRGDIDLATGFLCDLSPGQRREAQAFIARSQAPTSPFRVERFEVRGVSSHWVGTEPTFWVEVSFPRQKKPGEFVHAYRVHVRTGCIENFLTTSFLQNEQHRGPPAPNGASDGTRIEGDRFPSDEHSPPPVPRMPTVPPPAAAAPPTEFPDTVPASGSAERDDVIDL